METEQRRMIHNLTFRGETWEDRERVFMEGIERKASAIREIHHGIDSVTLEDTPEQVGEKFEEAASFMEAALGSEACAKARELFRLAENIEAERNQKDPLGIFPEDHKRFTDEYREWVKKAYRLAADSDVQVFHNSMAVLNKLKAKNELIRLYESSPGSLPSHIARMTNLWPRSKEAMLACFEEGGGIVGYTPFSVNFYPSVNEKGRGREGESVVLDGTHINGTVFNIIYDAKDPDLTTGHEEVHNKLDGADTLKVVSPVEVLSAHLWAYKNADSESSKEARKKDLLGISPQELVNFLHQEMLADAFESNNIAEHFSPYTLKPKRNSQKEKFSIAQESFTTAGVEAHKLAAWLRRQERLAIDIEVQEYMARTLNGFEKLYIQSVSEARTLAAVAERLGEDAHFDTEALLVVFPPTQYRHIRQYLNWKHGKGEVEACIASATISRNFSLQPESIVRLQQALREKPNMLVDMDKDFIIAYLEIQSLHSYKLGFAVNDIADLRSHGAALQDICESLGAPELATKIYTSNFRWFISYQYGATALANNFKDIDVLKSKCTGQEWDMSREALAHTIIYCGRKGKHGEPIAYTKLAQLQNSKWWSAIEKWDMVPFVESILLVEGSYG